MVPKYILVVEDDPSLAIIYERGLSKAGYEVRVDRAGDQWKSWVRERRPDAIVLDLHTPFAWGPDVIETLKKDPELRSIPRLITTADIIMGNRLQQAGEVVLTKPVGIERLVTTIQELLDQASES